MLRISIFLFTIAAVANAFVLPDKDVPILVEPEPFLMGGVVASVGQYPSAAYIQTPDKTICGAAVIDERHVVTLAQCVLDGENRVFNPRLVRVNTGDVRLTPVSYSRQSRLGSVIYVHENYKSHTLENDIAVIRVQEPFHLPSNEVEPAFRRTRIVGNDVYCYIAGWGATQTGATAAVDPQQRSIPVQINDRDICNGIPRGMQVFENMICAGNMVAVANGPSPCQGSIGSGLYCDGDLTGLLSFGINCGTANNPPTFTQIRFFNQWIDHQLTRNDVPAAGWSPLDQ